MRNRWVLLGLIFTITAVFAAGCYTVISHPGVQGEEQQAYNGSYYREHCTDCHADYQQYPYGYYYGYSPDYYQSYPNYGHYYNYPWWWDWYYGQPSGGGGTAVPSERLEKNRRSLQPPYVPGGQAINPPALTAPNTVPSQVPPAVQENQGQQPQQQEEKKPETQEGKIPKRNR